MITQEQKEGYWKILRAQTTMPEAMRILEYPEDRITEIMKAISLIDRNPGGSFAFHEHGLWLSLYAYDGLVKAGEIDGEKMFSLAEHTYPENPKIFDYGVMKLKMFRFEKTGWEPMS